MKKIRNLISIIGPPGVGKSTFCFWFIKRNPIYKHVDISHFREPNSNVTLSLKDFLSKERHAWTQLVDTLALNQYSILESNGLHTKLNTIYALTDNLYTIRLKSDQKIVTENIRTREKSIQDIDLELQSVVEDERLLNKGSWHQTATVNNDKTTYLNIEKLILLNLLEQH